jgi:hypothetical protein
MGCDKSKQASEAAFFEEKELDNDDEQLQK